MTPNACPLPDVPLAYIIGNAINLQTQSMEADTVRKYELSWNEFNDFLEVHNLEGSYSLGQIVLYLSWLENLDYMSGAILSRLD